MDIVRSVLNNLGFDAAVFLAQLALFYAMHLLLKPILYRPLENAFKQRASMTDDRVSEAQRFKDKAAALKAQYEQAIRETQSETLAITQAATKEAEAARQAELETARNTANGIIEKTRAELVQERREAQQTLEAEVPTLARAVAVKLAQAFTSGEIGEKFIKRVRGLG
ncbi:hypothetical protein IJT17_04890 [bacterium]|nr:hypothetical protein [bacterium]